MDEIELVVKIPEDVYRYAKKYNGSDMLTLREREMGMCMNAIANGTPLPKGHGRLIDADAIENYIKEDADEWDEYALAYVEDAPTITEQEIVKPYLDKIRAEIEKEAFTDVNNSKFISVNRVYQIFDKCKAESEGKQ